MRRPWREPPPLETLPPLNPPGAHRFRSAPDFPLRQRPCARRACVPPKRYGGSGAQGRPQRVRRQQLLPVLQPPRPCCLPPRWRRHRRPLPPQAQRPAPVDGNNRPPGAPSARRHGAPPVRRLAHPVGVPAIDRPASRPRRPRPLLPAPPRRRGSRGGRPRTDPGRSRPAWPPSEPGRRRCCASSAAPCRGSRRPARGGADRPLSSPARPGRGRQAPAGPDPPRSGRSSD